MVTTIFVLMVLVSVINNTAILILLERNHINVYREIGSPSAFTSGFNESFSMTQFVSLLGFLKFELGGFLKALCWVQALLSWVLMISVLIFLINLEY